MLADLAPRTKAWVESHRPGTTESLDSGRDDMPLDRDIDSAPPAWLEGLLACPKDGAALRQADSWWECPQGHAYPSIAGVPVLLDDELPSTLWVADASRRAALAAARGTPEDPYFLDTLGITAEECGALRAQLAGPDPPIDPVVSFMVGATNGIAYQHLRGRLDHYPIPALRLPAGNGRYLLDVGCNWGRWTLAAARLGYRAVGIDPSLGAVLAGRRVARRLGLDAAFVVGDARRLPFRSNGFDQVFSYSVLQHLSHADTSLALDQIGRVLGAQGQSLIQMPNRAGLRCLYHQLRRGFRAPHGFEVRYYGVGELRRWFATHIGPSTISVDCFFGIGLQASDLDLMPWTHRLAIRASERLRRLAEYVPPLRRVADSVYVHSRRADA